MKIGLISLYDINSFAIRTLHSVLRDNEIDVDSLFFKCNNPNNTMDIPTEQEKETLINFIKEKRYDIIGISFRSLFTSLSKDICLRLRKIDNNPLIVVGGIEPTLSPDRCLEYADIVVIGEGEQAILDICRNKKLKDIKNIYFKKGRRRIRNEVGFIEEDLDKIPFPDFSDENKYFINGNKVSQLVTKDFKARYSLMTSRGCPFSCKYCCNNILRRIYKGKYLRRRSTDNVIEELKKAKKDFPNLNQISFWDDVFTYDKDWIMDFLIKYKKEVNLPFFCFSNPNMCDPDIIKHLKDAGLYAIAIGVQTFSKRIKEEVYSRYEDNEKILRLASEINKYNIGLSFDIILDNPLEKEEDLIVNLEYLLKIKPPFQIHTHTLTYFPKTELTDNFLTRGLITEKEVEDEMEKGNKRWSLSMDLNRDNLNLFYDCLYVLTQSKYRSKFLIRKIQKNNYLKEHPEKLAKFMRFFSFSLLGTNWNSKFDRYKFYTSQGFNALFKGDFKFLFTKIKQLIKSPGVMNY